MAEDLASKKRLFISKMSLFSTLVFPWDSAKILEGVKSCTTYLREVLAPILPSSAKASSSRSIFSVIARMERIEIISGRE